MGSRWDASHEMAYGGVDLVPSYTGLVGQGRGVASPAHSTNIVISLALKSLSSGCKRWSAASSWDIPPGYVARAWFRYRAASMDKQVLRACSRAGALLSREMVDPSLVSRGASPIERG